MLKDAIAPGLRSQFGEDVGSATVPTEFRGITLIRI
jgi:hypothetical protein